MNVRVFNGELATMLDEFMHEWEANRGRDKSQFRETMEFSEWWDQFQFFVDKCFE